MATATKKIETIVRGVTLELSNDEAAAVARILGHLVTGRTEIGKKSSAVYNALYNLGYDGYLNPFKEKAEPRLVDDEVPF